MGQSQETRTLEQLYALRKQVVRLSLAGKPVMKIVALTGLSWTGVRKALDLYASGGIAALKPARRGRKVGSCRVLAPEEERRIHAIICTKRPEQLGMDFALWSRAAVMAMIKQECGINLQVRSVGKYLARWGFTPQKPIRKACAQNGRALTEWLERSYPMIEARMRTAGGEIHWWSMVALDNTGNQGDSHIPAGKTPSSRTTEGHQQKLSMIATVSSQGKARWMIIDEISVTDQLIDFFEALIRDTRRKILLILDKLHVHHSNPVKEWLSTHEEQIEIFYRPGENTEPNSDEQPDGNLKQPTGEKVSFHARAKLQAARTTLMEQLVRKPEGSKDCVRADFHDPGGPSPHDEFSGPDQ